MRYLEHLIELQYYIVLFLTTNQFFDLLNLQVLAIALLVNHEFHRIAQ
nr:MAG TPA: hypothetical protein [Caudoviricetes sp.]